MNRDLSVNLPYDERYIVTGIIVAENITAIHSTDITVSCKKDYNFSLEGLSEQLDYAEFKTGSNAIELHGIKSKHTIGYRLQLQTSHDELESVSYGDKQSSWNWRCSIV